MQDELHFHPCIFLVHLEVPSLLNYPRLAWMLRDPVIRIRRVPCSVTARTQTVLPSAVSYDGPCTWPTA
jgi:hypothetical protein